MANKRDAKGEKDARSTVKTKKEPEQKRNPYLYLLIALAVVAAVVVFLFEGPVLNTTVPFSTFKSGFQSAPRVSVTSTYSNQSQYEAESPCFTSLIQVIAHSRKASTIDFFIINQANDTCTYSSTGLGGSVSLSTSSSSHCLGIANSEPGIFLNYSQSNYTAITATHLSVYGNSEYMASCPIQVELN